MVGLQSLFQSPEHSCFVGRGARAFLEAQMSMIRKLKALKRCQAIAASVKDCTTACWSASEVHWGSSTVGQSKYSDCSGLLLQLGAGKNDISEAACSVTAGMQPGAFLKTASSAYECLDFVSVRLVP